MKISVKSSQGGMFGGGPSFEVVIECSDYEAGQATVTAMTLLAQNGIGEFPNAPEDDETTQAGFDVETEPDEDGYAESDDVPASGWSQTEKPDPAQRVSNPGDAVMLVWPDGTRRLFIDTGTMWSAPWVVGRFEDAMHVEFTDPDVAAYVVHAQPEREEVS